MAQRVGIVSAQAPSEAKHHTLPGGPDVSPLVHIALQCMSHSCSTIEASRHGFGLLFSHDLDVADQIKPEVGEEKLPHANTQP